MFQEQVPSCVLVGVLNRERVSGACFRSKLLRVYWLEYLPGSMFFGSVFQEQAPSCVLVGVLNRERVSGACFRSKLLRVYWLEYLPASVFRERVSGASSFVCTGWSTYPGVCFGSMFQEQAPSCVPAFRVARAFQISLYPSAFGLLFVKNISGAPAARRAAKRSPISIPYMEI